MSISNLADRNADAGPAAVVLVAATLALLAIPLLGRLAARGQQRRGGPARLFLEAQAGGSSAPAAGRRAAEPTAGLIQRLLGR